MTKRDAFKPRGHRLCRIQWLARRQRGLTLIEVLVSVVIFSIALLGTARLLVQQDRLGQEPMHRTLATMAASDLMQRMQLSPERSNSYTGVYEAATSEEDTFVQRDLADWTDQLFNKILLPEPIACVTVEQGVATIIISWQTRTVLPSSDNFPSCLKDDTEKRSWVRMKATIS